MDSLSLAVGGLLPDDAPTEVKQAVSDKLGELDPSVLLEILTDGLRCKELLDAGDREGAALILDRYRELSESVGLGPIFEQMLGDL